MNNYDDSNSCSELDLARNRSRKKLHMMSSLPRRYTRSGRFGNSRRFEDDDAPAEENITESGRSVAQLIANMKDRSDDMDFSITDSTQPVDIAPPLTAIADDSRECVVGVTTRARASSKAIPLPTSTTTEQPHSGSYESSGSAFVLGLMNNAQGGLSHTPPTGSSYETRHFGKRPRAGVSNDITHERIRAQDTHMLFMDFRVCRADFGPRLI